MTPTFQISLDGQWRFQHQNGPWRDAQVPLPWQAQFADLRQSSGHATYERSFAHPTVPPGHIAQLRFGAVSYLATVFLNGHIIGTHEGGYLPFVCAIPADLLQDTNLLRVECHLPDGASTPNFAEIPHGKQSWYGPIGGIWQSVNLEIRPAAHLTHCAITAQIGGLVTVSLSLSLPTPAELTVLSPGGTPVATAHMPAGQTETTVTVHQPDLWSPDAPHLYSLRVDLPQERTDHPFGFRSFTRQNGRFYLNGAPFYMRGALDQDYYPEGICTPPSVAFLEDQLHKAKALGLNLLRCHIKIPDPRYYEVADRLGMLIWTEIPNVGQFTPDSARRMRETMEGILARDGNHPSIVIWTLINEDWGTRLCEDPLHRAWLVQEYNWLKQRDPSRMVCDNSPCHGNFHLKTDINDFHYYRSVPERRAEWDALTAEFAAGADWTFSPHGDSHRRGDEPLVVSEFGVWGLPDPAQVTLNGQEPWWMGTGGTWGDGAAYPHGIQDRFATLQLSSVFGSFDNFITAAQEYQFQNLKYEIEVMRAWPQIQGYVITEFTDVHWESNGLLDMNRNPRVFHDRFSTVNSDVVIVPKVAHYAGYAGDSFSFDLAVATGGRAIGPCVLHWTAGPDNHGDCAVPATDAAALADLGRVTLRLPQGKSQILTVDLTLESAGTIIARNTLSVSVYARPAAVQTPRIGAEDPALAAYAQALGYTLTSLETADVILARALTPTDIQRLQSGATYLLLLGETTESKQEIRTDAPKREQPFISILDATPGLPGNREGQLPNMILHPRHGTMWRGDWIAGFSWIRRAGPFADIPGGPLVDLSFDRVIPHHVLTGFRAWEFGGPVHAGTVVGWAHKPAAFIAERAVGQGRVVANTFRLTGDAPGTDPVACHLLHALLALANTAE